MTPASPPLASRLPQVGTTVFSTMSALALEHGAVNLGQGFPDFAPDPALLAAVTAAMAAGHNQYAPMPGVPALREVVADKIARLYGHRYDPADEVTITAGATQAIATALAALVHTGDEVVVLEPCFDSYVPAILLAGGVPVRVPLQAPGFRPDFAAIAAACTARTRVVVVNTPHNPSATVWTADEMRQLAAVLRRTDAWLISDEVYEHMVYDGARHESVARHPDLVERAVLISSFGKTLHVTGWKIGYAAAPRRLMQEFRKVHQFQVFSVHTPAQHALATHLRAAPPEAALPGFYAAKRDAFRTGLAKTRLRPLPCAGTYFQCVDYSAVSDGPEAAFCRWLVTEVGVAAIPLSAFDGRERRVVRFCFAKRDATLAEALQRLVARCGV